MKRNEIISQKVGPLVKFLSVLAMAGLLSVVAFDKKSDSVKQEYNLGNDFVKFVNVFGISFIAVVFICCIVSVYNNANRTAIDIAKKYLEKNFANHPDFAQFQYVLNSPVAMRRIATMVSNEMRESEQQHIIKLLDKIELTSSIEQIEEIYNQIVNVIEGHSQLHPDFIEKVYSVIVHENYLLYKKQKQDEISKTFNQQKTK